MKNKAYRAFPLGQEAGAYLRQNRGRLLPNTYTTYESCLDKLARHFCDLELADFEPPIGTERLEEFIDEEWGERSARTRAKNISILKGFFEWAVLRGKLHGDPSRPIRPPKKRGVERTTFSKDQEQAIFAQNDRRDCLALHLLLREGIRKGALQAVQLRHFDHAQRPG
jgi:site-specific recombinase XerD